MAGLAIELLDQIFAFACSDGGRTACALRAVSRAFNAVAQRYRFLTVAISGHRQIHDFLWVFENASSAERGTVRYVFIFTDESDRSTEHSAAVTAILSLAAPTLRKLTCITSSEDDAIFNDLCSIYFPRLYHLTIKPPQSRSYLRGCEHGIIPKTLPSLTDVRIVLDDHPPGTRILYNACARASQLFLQCAQLTSVRISGLPFNTRMPDITLGIIDGAAGANNEGTPQSFAVDFLDEPSWAVLTALIRSRMKLLASSFGRSGRTRLFLPPRKPKTVVHANMTMQDCKDEWLRTHADCEQNYHDKYGLYAL